MQANHRTELKFMSEKIQYWAISTVRKPFLIWRYCMVWVKGNFPSCNHSPLFSRECPTSWGPWLFFFWDFQVPAIQRIPGLPLLFCFHYINKYLVTLSEQQLVPGSKVPLSLVKCCICCPLKLHPENGVSPFSELILHTQAQRKEELVAGDGELQGSIPSHWGKMELCFNHETPAQVSRDWEAGGSIMPKLINKNHSDYFLHEGIDWPRRWGMSTVPSYGDRQETVVAGGKAGPHCGGR